MKPLASVAEPDAVVTTTFTRPASCDGVVTVTELAEATTRFAPGVPPNVTDVAPVKFVPVMTIVEPPVVRPVFGEMALMVGAVAAMVMGWVALVSPGDE